MLGLVFLASFDMILEGSAAKSGGCRGGEGLLWALAVRETIRKSMDFHWFSLKLKIFQ